jgi:hypothetical protein
LGEAKYAQISQDIVYFPIYLISEDKVVAQIGLFEDLQSNLPNLTDSEGDIILDKMRAPILYDYVDAKYLEQYVNKEASDALGTLKERGEGVVAGTGDAGADDDDNEGDKRSDFKAKSMPSFVAMDEDSWIQRFFEDRDFTLKDNEGGGDCFFAAIRDGLTTIGKSVTVAEMRNRVSAAATPDIYQTYRTLYEAQADEVKAVEARLKVMTQEAKELKEQAAAAGTKQERALVLEKARALRGEMVAARSDKASAKELLQEVSWMAKLTSFEKFKRAIRTCSFWADDWAVSLMENLYNMKFILLSEENYAEGDFNNVLLCGQGDQSLLDKGMFRPTEYIILVHTGNHYKLVLYDGKGAFTYDELPSKLVRMVREKCMERNSGLFAIIPEFNQDLVLPDEEIEEPSDLHLHGEDVVLQFYDEANIKPKAGKGAGETIEAGVAPLKELTGNWRRKLAHGYEHPIKLDGHMWKTVEHYVQAQKFKNTAPQEYLKFTMDEGHALGQDAAMARAAGNKKKFEGKLVLPKEVEIDADFDADAESQAKARALAAKFADEEMAAVLKATRDAKLMEYRKGKPARIEVEMMRIRHGLA